jgi:hypothetical protein
MAVAGIGDERPAGPESLPVPIGQFRRQRGRDPEPDACEWVDALEAWAWSAYRENGRGNGSKADGQ